MAIRTERVSAAEPWRATAARSGSIALAIGLGVGLYQQRPAAMPLAALFALWFSLGGHFVELLFLRQLQPQIGDQALLRALARLLWWFAGGAALYAGALATRALLSDGRHAPWPWWTGGVAFVGLELLIHLVLRARHLPSFYDGRG